MDHRRSVVAVIVIVVVVCGAALAAAQPPDVILEQADLRASSPEEQLALTRNLGSGGETYGTDTLTVFQIPVAAFVPYGSSNYLIVENYYMRLPNSSYVAMAPLNNLPNGAYLEWIGMAYNDSSALGDPEAKLFRSCGVNPPVVSLLATVDSGGDSSGYGYAGHAMGHTINNDCQYWVQVTGLVQDSALQYRRIKAVTFWYRLQISPAPATATFNDVPVGAFGFQHVEALYASGITAGCGGGNFCPDAPLTRVQMAVFLAKALGLHWEF